MAEITVNGKKYNIQLPLAKGKSDILVSQQSYNNHPSTRGVVLGKGRRAGTKNLGNEGVFVSSEYYRDDFSGKPYPGRINFNTQRVLAYNSTVVRAIITLRAHQVAKLPIKIKPKSDDEPPRQLNLLDYAAYDIENHPAFDEAERTFLSRIYERLDPSHIKDKKQVLDSGDVEVSDLEHSTLVHLQRKHDDFYKKRNKDIARIKKLLNDPDPWFTDTRSWEKLVKSILADLLILDRGVVILLRDQNEEIRGILPADGATLLPLINEYGVLDPERAYVQVVHGNPRIYLKKRDVVVMMMNPTTDLRYFGYGFSNMETLYIEALADIFIDKGQLDFYRKGGSIPEGLISIEPPPSKDGLLQIDQEQLETIQRQLVSLMAGDYTQVPIVSGGRVNFIDFKGKHRDMQYKELADYLARKTCAVMQVSPQDVGITGDVNRATSEVMNDMTKSKGLETLMRTISEYFTQYVIRELRPEDDLMLWFEDADIDKEKALWQIDQQKLVSGVQSINQWRAAHGKYPVPWGHTPLQGLRNWTPEDDKDGGGGLLGGLGGGLPPLGGAPMPPPGAPPPGIMNPGGPVGGGNPGSGMPPMPPGGAPPIGSPTNLKSMNFFKEAYRKYPDATDEELMVKGFSDMYEASMKTFLDIQDVRNYPGSENIRSPRESYEYLVNSNPQLGLIINVEEEIPGDILLFSNYNGNGIVSVNTEFGTQPLIKSLSQGVLESMGDKLSSITEVTGDGGELEGVERALFKSLDPNLREALYEDFYKFSVPEVTDAQVEKVGELLELSSI